jgi:hypothetical protein
MKLSRDHSDCRYGQDDTYTVFVYSRQQHTALPWDSGVSRTCWGQKNRMLSRPGTANIDQVEVLLSSTNNVAIPPKHEYPSITFTNTDPRMIMRNAAPWTFPPLKLAWGRPVQRINTLSFPLSTSSTYSTLFHPHSSHSITPQTFELSNDASTQIPTC